MPWKTARNVSGQKPARSKKAIATAAPPPQLHHLLELDTFGDVKMTFLVVYILHHAVFGLLFSPVGDALIELFFPTSSISRRGPDQHMG